jgi:ATP-dependent protease HslVU (ClpYQ) peptidase subunit
MTTILADTRFGVMVADSAVSDGDRVWTGRKVRRIRGALIGMAGNESEEDGFLRWYRAGMDGPISLNTLSALILDATGLYLFDHNYALPMKLEAGREAIGSGAKAAMCAYEALCFTDPKRAVQIVCKHDADSRGPVRVYKL